MILIQSDIGRNAESMSPLDGAARTRKSFRAFLDKPVPDDLPFPS